MLGWSMRSVSGPSSCIVCKLTVRSSETLLGICEEDPRDVSGEVGRHIVPYIDRYLSVPYPEPVGNSSQEELEEDDNESRKFANLHINQSPNQPTPITSRRTETFYAEVVDNMLGYGNGLQVNR